MRRSTKKNGNLNIYNSRTMVNRKFEGYERKLQNSDYMDRVVEIVLPATVSKFKNELSISAAEYMFDLPRV